MSLFAVNQPYGYGSQTTSARNFSANGTSSAFSSAALPDEDWTKISDLAERRRIQNRIAQRNYRKKLKRRLEDLERRAGSSDEGEPERKAHSTAANKPKRQAPVKPQKSTPAGPATKSIKSFRGQFTPPMENNDDVVFHSPVYHNRDRSRTPPMFSYPSYPGPDEILMDPYASTQPYPPAISSADPYPNYMTSAAMPVTLPALSTFGDHVKSNEDSMSPYLHYSFVPSAEVNMSSHFESSNAHTPPLSHSYDTSTSCSEAGYEHPTTPLSMPGSPGMPRSQQ